MAPRVTGQLVVCGLLVDAQSMVMVLESDKKNGKDNDRGLCVAYFIFLSLLVFVPFVVRGHARPGPLF